LEEKYQNEKSMREKELKKYEDGLRDMEKINRDNVGRI
jgi:hypothetical protein